MSEHLTNQQKVEILKVAHAEAIRRGCTWTKIYKKMVNAVKGDKPDPSGTLLDDFNKYFNGNAKAEIVNGQLEITVGSITLSFSMPGCVGVKATGPS